VDRRLELNRGWWDERVPIHVGSAFYDVDGFRSGGSTLRPFEVAEVGDVAGKRLAHLQCHFGLDSLSWARAGASVAGLDFSDPAVEAANALAAETGLDARFVQADVYDAVDVLSGPFDVVYTGLGAINWLPDLPRWAGVIAELLEPGGFLYLAEFHPFTWGFADEDLTVVYDYFHDPAGVGLDDGETGSYADLEARTEHNATLEWAHPISDVVNAVLGAGLQLELLSEHDYTLFPRWPHLEPDTEMLGRGVAYRHPSGTPRLPLMFSLRARKP
jgi:SAM-dependent methyltransferase